MPQTEAATLTLAGLAPAPEAQWQEMRAFLGLGEDDLAAMRTTLEILLRHGPELVRGNYDYLQQFPSTAAILGWEDEVDPAHLEERRRFLTLWLGRNLGLDLSADFARYLYQAGQIHAGLGPRQIRVPPLYVTGAISLVQAAFARYFQAEMTDPAQVGAALTGWNKYLSMQLHMMLAGYEAGMARIEGEVPVTVVLLGRLRQSLGRNEVLVRVASGATVADVLRKFFNCFPEAREEVFRTTWEEGESRSAWMHVEAVYELRPHWNILLGGRDLRFHGGFAAPLGGEQQITIMPPGR